MDVPSQCTIVEAKGGGKEGWATGLKLDSTKRARNEQNDYIYRQQKTRKLRKLRNERYLLAIFLVMSGYCTRDYTIN
jgi:hypothetical protein